MAKILQQLVDGLNHQVAELIVLEVYLFEAEMVQAVEFANLPVRFAHLIHSLFLCHGLGVNQQGDQAGAEFEAEEVLAEVDAFKVWGLLAVD